MCSLFVLCRQSLRIFSPLWSGVPTWGFKEIKFNYFSQVFVPCPSIAAVPIGLAGANKPNDVKMWQPRKIFFVVLQKNVYCVIGKGTQAEGAISPNIMPLLNFRFAFCHSTPMASLSATICPFLPYPKSSCPPATAPGLLNHHFIPYLPPRRPWSTTWWCGSSPNASEPSLEASKAIKMR